MKTELLDRQEASSPIDGQVVTTAAEIRRVLAMAQGRPPFFAELVGENGFKLLLGLGPREGCAQFSAADGSAPYFMAVADDREETPGDMVFLIAGTASPVPRRYCLPLDTVVRIAETFVETGQRRNDLVWEEI